LISTKFSFAGSTFDLPLLSRIARTLIRPIRKSQRLGESARRRWDRREFPRSEVQVDARFKILRPKESFNAIALRGTLLNISPIGARAAISNLLHSDYLQLVRNPTLRYVTVQCSLGAGSNTRLFGMISHFDYHGEESEPACHIGITFGQMEPEDRRELGCFLASVKC